MIWGSDNSVQLPYSTKIHKHEDIIQIIYTLVGHSQKSCALIFTEELLSVVPYKTDTMLPSPKF